MRQHVGGDLIAGGRRKTIGAGRTDHCIDVPDGAEIGQPRAGAKHASLEDELMNRTQQQVALSGKIQELACHRQRGRQGLLHENVASRVQRAARQGFVGIGGRAEMGDLRSTRGQCRVQACVRDAPRVAPGQLAGAGDVRIHDSQHAPTRSCRSVRVPPSHQAGADDCDAEGQ